MQLLEDYKHGTLRPGVTNEQVTLLEVGWGSGGGGRKVANSLSLPRSQNHFSSPPNPLLLLHLLGLLDFGGDTQGSPVSWSGGKYGGC